MNKYLIAGGAVVVGLVGLAVVRRHRAASSQDDGSQDVQVSGPVSGGYAPVQYGVGAMGGSVDTSGINVPQASINAPVTASTDANAPGVSDFGSLLTDYMKGVISNQHFSILSNEHISDATTLAGIDFGGNGTATVSHSDTGTTLSVQATLDPLESQRKSFVDSLYSTLLNRTPDAGGEAYWIGQLRDHVLSQDQVVQNFYNSDEYKKLHSSDSSTQNQTSQASTK